MTRGLRHDKAAEVGLGLLGTLIVAGGMEAAVRAGLLSSNDVPLVSEVVPRFFGRLAESGFWSDTGVTLTQTFIGLGIATAVAVPVGALIGSVEIVWRALRPAIELLRPVPGVALIPLVTLIWGATNLSVVVLCAFVSLWPMLIQSVYGVREVDTVALEAARSYGLNRTRRALRVILPSSLPFVATGIRVATSASLILAITVEFLAGAPGLGQQLTYALSGDDNTLLYALILAACLLGLVLNLVQSGVERWLLRWSSAYREEGLWESGGGACWWLWRSAPRSRWSRCCGWSPRNGPRHTCLRSEQYWRTSGRPGFSPTWAAICCPRCGDCSSGTSQVSAPAV
jgi:ABC-type nitrate/sulfonate/bicarbonate transport system permease component